MENGTRPSDRRGHRTLAAIVFTDGVGFSARMSADEEHTLDLIRQDLQLMSDLCERFEGHVLKSTGDGLLMYFRSAVSAVACALEIQKSLAAAALNLPANDVISHRIGIHLGDVFFSDSDVMGNGVNIAARLQTVADPGGICMSQTVYDVVKTGLPVQATYLGPRELKNIQEAVPVYQILYREPPENTGSRHSILPANTTLSRQECRDRQILLNKVKNYWVKGVLETSLHGRTLIELGLEERLDAVELPWGMVWETPDRTRHPLPAGASVIDKFKEMGSGGTLLILGQPGGGKTTTLLQLARHLIATAERDINQPVPVVFNLSSWTNEMLPIARWLVQELNTKYQVSKEIGAAWIENQQLLLLLDGLDEVSPLRRFDCVEAINQFSQEHGQTEIVVCSRIGDYEALSMRLRFQSSLYLQPLTIEQIQDYLAGTGAELSALATALSNDSQLQELAKSPLMLSIMTLAYQGIAIEDLPCRNLEEHRQHLFDLYIQRMFNRRGADSPYSKEQAMRWLIWLAARLSEKSQTVFLIERLQPDWLQTKLQKQMYALGLLLNFVLICGGIFQHFLPLHKLIICLFFGVSIAWIIFGIKIIKPVETLKWSWNTAVINICLGIILGSIFGVTSKLIYELITNPLHWSLFEPSQIDVRNVLLIRGMVFGLSVGLVFGLIRGLTGPGIETITVPNQGIWQSAKNAIVLASIGILVLAIAALLLKWSVWFWGSFGIIFGLAAGGGEACFKHFTLRVVLYCSGYIPWNYARFLDWASERIFLQKVGGGYIFIHRLLLEHFAAMSRDS